MADISIQFHALPEELLSFTREFMADFALYVVAMRFFPFEANIIPFGNLSDVFSPDSSSRELAFTLTQPVLPVNNNIDFYDKNPDSLRLDIERVTNNELRQTWLTCRTDNSVAFGVWRKIAKRLKSSTLSGVVVVDPNTGAAVSSRSFRYTTGAKGLALAGVTMRPTAGGCVVKFIDDVGTSKPE